MVRQAAAFFGEFAECAFVVSSERDLLADRVVLTFSVTSGGCYLHLFPAERHRAVLAPLDVYARAHCVLAGITQRRFATFQNPSVEVSPEFFDGGFIRRILHPN